MTRTDDMQALAERALAEIDKDFGRYPGYRAAQAKGTVCRGTFHSTGKAAGLTTAAHLQPKAATRVTARFANSATNPMRPDGRLDVRGMSTAFHLPGGRRTDIVALRMSRFLVGTANQFLLFQRAIRRPPFGDLPLPSGWSLVYLVNGKLPRTLAWRQLRSLCRVSSYAGSRYNSLHAFKLVDATGTSHYVRYSWVPEAEERKLHWWQTHWRDPDYLRHELADRLVRGPVCFRLEVQIAEGNDPVNDASEPWPDDRERIQVGTLELTDMGSWDAIGREPLRFEPTRMTEGIELPDGDSLLELRRHVYALSADRRSGADGKRMDEPRKRPPAAPPDTSKKVPANGIHICFDTIGPANGRPLLLIMGFACSMTWWQPSFCDQLVHRGFRVIRFDNRDCGRSTHIDARVNKLIGLFFPGRVAPYTVDDMADDAAALLEEIDVAAAHVMGISMGGMIGQALAIRHPDRVLSLTCIASTPRFRLRPFWPFRRLRVMARLSRKPPEDEDPYVDFATPLWRLLNATHYVFEEPNVRGLLHASYKWSRGPDPSADFRQVTAVRAATDRTPALRKLKQPTLVIHGTDDPLVPFADGVATATAIEGARLLPIRGMGHYTPKATWKTVIDGLDEVARRAEHQQTP